MTKKQSSGGKRSPKTGADSRLARRREKPKSFERYEQNRPIQLTFFEILEPANRQYSNTVEIYDFLPKEYLGKATRVADTYLPRLEREFECRGVKYRMKLDPARIEDKDGTVREFYPSQREEVVEDCLRKLTEAEFFSTIRRAFVLRFINCKRNSAITDTLIPTRRFASRSKF